MSNFTNSEDPDEMQHNAAFHQGLTVCKSKQPIFLNFKPATQRYV